MRNIRVIAGGVIVCWLASGMLVGGAAAQTTTAGPGGQPIQLLKFGKTDAKPRSKLAAKSSTKSAAKSGLKARIALRRKAHARLIVAEQKRRQLPARLPAAPQVVVAPPAADNGWPAAPTAMAVDAATLAPTPQIVAPVAALTPSELVVDGQTVQVVSADEANEIDLAANDASVVANDGSLSTVTANNAAITDLAGPAVKSDSTAGAAVSAAPRVEVGSTSWLLQVMAALGGAVAAGSAAWFLIGSAPQRMYG